MKKVSILLLIVILLTSCTSTEDSNLQTTDAMKDDQISFYIHYIDSLKYHEHTVDTIYSLHMTKQEVSINKTKINDNSTKYYMTIDEANSLEDIHAMKISNNNQYMAITFNEQNGNIATKLKIFKLKELIPQDNLKNVSSYKLYEYELSDFIEKDENENELNFIIDHIHISGFTADGKVLWGGIAKRVELSYIFIIYMDTGKIEFLKYLESYNKARNKYEVSH